MALPALTSAALLAGRDSQPGHQGQRHNRDEKGSHKAAVGKQSRNSKLNFAVFLLLASCGGTKHALVEDLNQREDFGLMRVGSARGIRDGDRLSAQLLLTDTSNILTLDLHFLVTPPTHLESGSWTFSRGTSGRVEARSITFLGGQSGPPSLGGTFDLLDSQSKASFRVHFPTTLLPK